MGAESPLVEAIRALGDRRAAALNAKKPEEMAQEFYAEDALLLPPDEAIVSGRDGIEEFWRRRIEAGLLEFSVTPQLIDGSDDVAYEVGQFMYTFRPPYGALLRDRGKYLVVYRRQPDGAWQSVADIFTTDESGH